MDDMGMRNNGSAIISVLNVGIVFAKYGSVTDDEYVTGKYKDAVDIGTHKYGKHNKSMNNQFSLSYKRAPYSRDSNEIITTIINRELNQINNTNSLENSLNYKTVQSAQQLLTNKFTLEHAAENLQGAFQIIDVQKNHPEIINSQYILIVTHISQLEKLLQICVQDPQMLKSSKFTKLIHEMDEMILQKICSCDTNMNNQTQIINMLKPLLAPLIEEALNEYSDSSKTTTQTSDKAQENQMVMQSSMLYKTYNNKIIKNAKEPDYEPNKLGNQDKKIIQEEENDNIKQDQQKFKEDLQELQQQNNQSKSQNAKQ